MANILITGASGFLGANLAHRLASSNNEISVFVHKPHNFWRIKKITPSLDVHVVDLTNIEKVRRAVKNTDPDIVFHLATYGVYSHQDDVGKILDTNITGSVNLMNVLSESGNIKKFVNLGSSFEYGPKLGKIKETSSTTPASLYSVSKVSQTNFAQYFAEHRKLPALTLRIFNAYGMFEDKKRLIPSIMLSALSGKTLHIRNPNEVRDFVFVNDVVDAMLKASTIKKSGIILNIGTSIGHSVEQIVRKSLKAANSDINVIFKGRKEEQKKLVADISQAKKVLGWKPKFSIDDGLKETFDWFKDNLRLYRN